MGWTGINTRKSFDQVFKEEYADAFYKQKILKYAEIAVQRDSDCNAQSEFYIAVRRENGTIGCNVIIFKRYNAGDKDEEVVFKEMDEGMGPYCDLCPEDIFKLLSPIDKLEYPGYTKEFRERQMCYRNNHLQKQSL